MNNNKKHMEALEEIQKMVKIMSGQKMNINESVMFEDDFDKAMEEPANEKPAEEIASNNPVADQNMEKEPVKSEDSGMKELEESGELDTIRAITLKGMMALNKTPEDPKFQALLKIFQICNKAVDTNEEDKEKKI